MSKPKYNELPLEKQVKIAKMYDSGLSSLEIAKQENTNASTVLKYALKHNGKKRTCSEGKRLYSLNQSFFEKIDTEDKAYWLGFLYADGHLNVKADIIVALSLKDESHLKKFNKSLSSEMPIRHKICNSFNKKYELVRIDIRSKIMRDDLLNNGFGYDKSFKFNIKNIPDKLIRHFWRGVIDGDGSFGLLKDGYPFFCVVGNYDSMEAFKLFIYKNLKINKNINKHKTIFCLKAGGKIAFSIIELLYKDSFMFLDRKFENYLTIKNKY